MPEDDRPAGSTDMGQYMKTLRRARGLSQTQLVERLDNRGEVVGMAQSTISRIEAGQFHPFAGQLELMLRALEATEMDARNVRALCARDYRRR